MPPYPKQTGTFVIKKSFDTINILEAHFHKNYLKDKDSTWVIIKRDPNISINSATASQYQFNMYGIGIGYKYIGYRKYYLLSPIFDVALHYLHLNAYRYTGNNNYIHDADQIKAMHLRTDLFQVKIGLGAAFRINAQWDIHLMPNFSFLMNNVNKTTAIGTRLHNTGLQLGINYRFHI